MKRAEHRKGQKIYKCKIKLVDVRPSVDMEVYPPAAFMLQKHKKIKFVYCGHCGEQIEDDFNYCPYCGVCLEDI